MDAQQYEGPYWVIGGEYADTGFQRIVPGQKEERMGPFHSYADAYAAWQKASWRHVDQCYFRYRIVEAGENGERQAA